MKENKDQNLIKKTAKELGMTYKELGEAIGYTEGTLNKNASTGEVSKPIEKAIELYLETLDLKKELHKFQTLKEIIKEMAR